MDIHNIILHYSTSDLVANFVNIKESVGLYTYLNRHI